MLPGLFCHRLTLEHEAGRRRRLGDLQVLVRPPRLVHGCILRLRLRGSLGSRRRRLRAPCMYYCRRHGVDDVRLRLHPLIGSGSQAVRARTHARRGDFRAFPRETTPRRPLLSTSLSVELDTPATSSGFWDGDFFALFRWAKKGPIDACAAMAIPPLASCFEYVEGPFYFLCVCVFL